MEARIPRRIHGERPPHRLRAQRFVLLPRADPLVSPAREQLRLPPLPRFASRFTTEAASHCRGERIDGCRRSDARPAERAIGVGLEPGVDAIYVEDVEAARQQPDPLLLSEPAEADGALAGSGEEPPVSQRRDRANGGLVEAELSASGGVVVVLLLPPAEPANLLPVEAALSHEDVVTEKEEGGGEDSDDGHDDDDGEAGDGGKRRRHGMADGSN